MKKALSILLSICLFFTLLVTMSLGIVRANINGDAISKLLSDVVKGGSVSMIEFPDNGLYYPENGNHIVLSDFDISDLGIDVSDLNSLDVNQIIKNISEEYDVAITEDIIAEIVSSPEAVDFLSKYTEEIVDYVTGKTTEFNVDPEDVKKVANSSISIYEKATGEVIDRTGLDENIEASVSEASVSITQGLDEAKEEMGENLIVLQKVNLLLGVKFFIILICACVGIILLILLLNLRKIGSFLKFVAVPSLIDGILFLCAGLSVTFGITVIASALNELLPSSIINAVLNYIRSIVQSCVVLGLIITVVAVALLVVGIILGKKQKPATPEVE